MFHGTGSYLVVRSPVIASSTSVVQAQPLIAATRVHRPHSTEDKTPRLMVKKHSTAKRTQRNSHTYNKKEDREKKKKKG